MKKYNDGSRTAEARYHMPARGMENGGGRGRESDGRGRAYRSHG